MLHRRETVTASVGLALLVLAVALSAGCGEERRDGEADSGRRAAANATDRKFLAEMKPHHRGAIEMAEIARRRASQAEIGSLATSIIAAQSTEIQEIERIQRRIGKSSVDSAEERHGAMDAQDLAELRSARPFDKKFIELMVPHHDDAIQMSRAVLEMGGHPETRALARRIMVSQGVEIRRMTEWYRRWYRKPVPSTSSPHDGGAAHR